MKYLLKSICTTSFWRYALFSGEALTKLFAAIGALWLFMELMDFLSIYTKDKYSKFAIFPIFLISAGFVVVTQRPVSRVTYKVPKKDFLLAIRIGNLFDQPGDIVISTSTTFDTNIANGLISPDSLQGQFALKYFQGNTAKLDVLLDNSLQNANSTHRTNAPGKDKEYPIGTVAKVETHGKIFYFVAMARLSDQGTAGASVRDIEDALDSLWQFIANHGELRDIVIPLMGTGRGRIQLPRRKVIERIAQSFADASRNKVFSNKLTIVVSPKDAENFGVNLFEARDYLVRSLHV